MLTRISKTIIIIFYLSISSGNLIFANEIENDYLTGKVYLTNGDTLKTKIHLSFYRGDFVRKLYIDNFGHYLDAHNKVRGLNPNKINGFEVSIDSSLYQFISKKIQQQDKKKIFFHLLNTASEPVVLYEYFSSGTSITLGSALSGAVGGAIAASASNASTGALYRIEYNNGAVYYPKMDNFKEDKIAYILSDCKIIETKIKNGEYKYSDMPTIIEAYNKWYTN